MRCAVKNCQNYSKMKTKSLRFFRFPRDKDLSKKWIAFCGKGNINIYLDSSSVCIEHFKPSDFERNLKYEMGFSKRNPYKLKPTAVPTILCPNLATNKDDERIKMKESILNKKTVSDLLENYQKDTQIKNEIESEEILVEEIKTEPEFVRDECDQSTIEYYIVEEIAQKNTPKNKNETEVLVETLRKQIATLKKENLVLRQAAKKHVSEMHNLNNSLKKSEYQRMNIEKHLRLIFTDGQMKKLKNGIEKRLVWNEEDITKAMELYSISTKAYELLQKNNFPLPSIRTLQTWIKQGKAGTTRYKVLNEAEPEIKIEESYSQTP